MSNQMDKARDEPFSHSWGCSYPEGCNCMAGKLNHMQSIIDAQAREVEKMKSAIALHKDYTYSVMGGPVHLGDIDLWEIAK